MKVKITAKKGLATNNTMITLLQNIHKLAIICLSIRVGTPSVERSFLDKNLIETRLQNRISEVSLANLMKIVT